MRLVMCGTIVVVYGIPLPALLWAAMTRDPSAWIGVAWGSVAVLIGAWGWNIQKGIDNGK